MQPDHIQCEVINLLKDSSYGDGSNSMLFIGSVRGSKLFFRVGMPSKAWLMDSTD